MDKKGSSIRPESFLNRVFVRNQRLGLDACHILSKAIEAVDSYQCVYDYILLDGQALVLGKKVINLGRFERVFLIGFGKASVPMAQAILDRLGTFIVQADVVTKDEKFLKVQEQYQNLRIYLGGHPIPTADSINSTAYVLNSLPKLTTKDLVLIVISGGGSALFCYPSEDIQLDDLQKMTQLLLNSGANIQEINTLRKHLDQVKGGRLAAKLMPAQIESLILSDVIGDHLDMIASGPTVEDVTTFLQSLSILKKYSIIEKVPNNILAYLNAGATGKLPETPKPGELPVNRLGYHLVGTNYLAVDCAREHAKKLGYHATIISTYVEGLTDHVAHFLGGIIHTQIRYQQPADLPACLIFGGEPTVKVCGHGLGGRNTDLTLRMVKELAGFEQVLFVALATDGNDGPTDAAGAVTDGFVLKEGIEQFGLDVHAYLKNSDSYHYFEKVGGLIKTGATGTNVNDIYLMLFGPE